MVFNGTYVLAHQTPRASNGPTSCIPSLRRLLTSSLHNIKLKHSLYPKASLYCHSLIPRPHPACICAILKAIRTGVGFGSGTETSIAI